MDLQADLKWIHKELDKVKDPIFIKAIKSMLKYSKKMTSERISKEQYNQELEVSIAQIEDGKTFTHQQIKERMEQWIEK